jgi:Phage capsid protein
MSYEVNQSFVQQYKDNVVMLSQQKGSRLRNTVRTQPDIVGQNFYFERIGATAAQQRTTRHGDTPLISTPHSRRQLTMGDYEWADLIDSQDKLRLLINPESHYVVDATNAFGRAIDDLIIAAATGTSQSGVDGQTAVTWASLKALQILGSSYNSTNDAGHFSIPKLLTIKKIFELADVDPDEDRFGLVSPYQLQDMLETTQVTSADYNTMKALAAGAVDAFAGFKFIMTNRLSASPANTSGLFASTTSNSTDRQTLWYTRNGLGLGIAEDITTRISERADKGYSTQVYMRMTMGSTRIEDVKVVEADCVES